MGNAGSCSTPLPTSAISSTCLPGTDSRGVRHVPVEGIVATDAELDHTVGIMLLREARHLQLYATTAVRSILERDSRILPVTQAFAEVEVIEMALDGRVALRLPGRHQQWDLVEAFHRAGGPASLCPGDRAGHTVGLILRDETGGGACAFVPGCGELDEALVERLGATDLLLFDGTFWTDDELIALGISERSAREWIIFRYRARPAAWPGSRVSRGRKRSTPTSTTPIRCCWKAHPSVRQWSGRVSRWARTA